MTKPVLFISHSTCDCDDQYRVVQVRKALSVRLSDNWNVFVDVERIQGGDRWRPKILDHIQRAQAAIILFDRRATSRDWVVAETLMFCFRKSLVPSFQFVPILFDELKLSDTTFDKYEPFGLNEVQTIADRGQEVEVLVDRIVSQFQPVPAQGTPSSQWIEQLLTILDSVSTDGWLNAADAIEIDCTSFDGNSIEFQPCLPRCIGQLMHHHAWQKIVNAIERLLKHLALKYTSKKDAGLQQQKLCKLIRTKWVPNESVEVMLCASHRRTELGVLAINIEADETDLLEQYQARLRSEFQGSLRLISVPAATAEDDESKVFMARSAIFRTLFPNGRLPRDDSGVTMSLEDAVSARLQDDRFFAVLALPPQYATTAVIQELRRSFPRIVLLVAVPRNEETLPNGARWLPPRITIKNSNEFYDLDNRLLSACNN